MKKITCIVADINKSVGFEWYAGALDKNKFELSFILINPTSPSELGKFLEANHIPVYYLSNSSKINSLKSFFKAFKILRHLKSDVVHCHLTWANIIGLTAAKLAGVKKRIYTRHHSDFNLLFNKKGVWIDKYCNYLATDIIAISVVVKDILIKSEKVKPEKVKLIHHGFDLEYFKNFDPQVLEQLKNIYNPQKKYPLIGVVSRFTEWKGVQYIIPAFKTLLQQYPDAKLLLFNAVGEYEAQIQAQLNTLTDDQYQKIKFEKNSSEMYRLFDVFVHTPFSPSVEAFGQVYAEALAAGIPSVFTLSGVANEFIIDQQNALVVEYKNSDEIASAIVTLLKEPTLKDKIVTNGATEVNELFNYKKYIAAIENLYQ